MDGIDRNKIRVETDSEVDLHWIVEGNEQIGGGNGSVLVADRSAVRERCEVEHGIVGIADVHPADLGP